MRVRMMVKGVNATGELILKDMYEFPVVYTKSNKFDELTQSVFTQALEYLRREDADIVVIERVRTEAVDNGDGTGSMKGKLVGMGF